VAGFELLDELGRGGRTVTYRVRRHSSVYAMKILQRRSGEDTPERAFRREAALLASVRNPGLVRVHEVGEAGGLPYLVMDYVDGQSLSQLLAAGQLSIPRVLRLGIDIGRALDAAHQARLVHRDIKPDNILVGTDGHAWLIDFGLAIRPGEIDAGATVGTLLYCAPEQTGMLHRPVDGRADLYALGAVLFECVTGRPPFVSADVGELLRMHVTAPVPEPRTLRPDLPPSLTRVIGRLLAKDPDDRYQSADGLVADLRRLVDDLQTDFPLGLGDHAHARADRPLVGREAELTALLARWQNVHSGTGGAAMVVGPAGSGKSRLARELADRVRAAGGLVLSGGCAPGEGAPLAPFQQAVDDHLAAVARLPKPERDRELDRVRAAVGSTASLLIGLSPALDALLEAPGLPEFPRHQQFSAAVAELLAKLTKDATAAVLHLDDVHWLSPTARRILARLIERLGEIPLLIVLSGRDDDASAETMAAVRDVVGDRLDLTVRLKPLTVAAVADLVSAATGGLLVDDATAASLATRSGGNTFTLLQYLDAVLDAGLLRPHWGHWHLDTEDLHAVRLSVDGVNVILDRLDQFEQFDRFDPESRYLLGLGAVYGPVFDHVLIADAAGLPSRRMLEVADVAAWYNLVERRDGGRYAFLHDRIREALVGQFDPDGLVAAHRQLADALSRVEARDPEAVYALARHCLGGGLAGRPSTEVDGGSSGGPDAELGATGGDPGRVFAACWAAGQQALAAHAPAEALDYLDRAAQVASEAGITPDSAFLIALATAQHRAGKFGDAVETATLARQRSTDPAQRARILYLTAVALTTAWQTVRPQEAVEQALVELGHPSPRTRIGRVLAALSSFVMGGLVRKTGIGHGTVRGHKRELLKLRTQVYAHATWTYGRQLRPLEAILFTVRSNYPVARLGPGAEEAMMRMGFAHADLAMGLRRRARRNTALAWESAKRAGDPLVSVNVAWIDGFLRHNYGLDQGETMRRVLDEHGAYLDVGLQSDMIFILLWDALQRGAVADAQRLADRRRILTTLTGRGSEPTARSEAGASTRALTAVAALLAWQDRPEEAAALLANPHPTRRRWELVPVYGAAMTVAYEHRRMAEFDDAVERFDGLRMPVKMLIGFGGGFHVTRSLGRVEQCRTAPAADRPRRLEQAREAVELMKRVARIPVLKAHYEVIRAGLLQVQGEADAALRHLSIVESSLHSVDAPAVGFEAARVRAFALRDKGVAGESERQARLALSIAVQQDWRHRARQIASDFGIDDPARTAATVGMNDTVALGRYRQRLDAIEQLGLAASRVLDPNQLAAISLDETVRILGGERAFLFLTDGARLVPQRGRTADGQDLDELVGYSTSTVEKVHRTGSPVVLTRADDGDAEQSDSVILHGLRSILAAPVQLDGRMLGVVYLDSRVARGIFTAEDVRVLTAITNHIAVALETARAAQLEVAVAMANRQRDVAETLRSALADIAGELEATPQAVLARLRQSAARTIGAQRAWLVLGSPTDALADVHGSDGKSTVEVTPALAGLLAADTAVVSEDSSLLAPGESCLLAIPLRPGTDRLGILVLASTTPHAFADGQADLAAALVRQAEVAYENARLFTQVQHLATVDDLTGIANRRHFFVLAARALARVRGRDVGLTAMMVDIDHFKSINDEYGHQVGDEVIQEVARRLSRLALPGDVLGRYGGEEFALLARDLGPDPTAAAERLRAAVSDTPVATQAGPLTVTVSVGAASQRPDDLDVGTLLGRADHNLYEAKRAGRNRVAAT
jgi:diguanylate cyclase (GGDEF)-like protein